LERELLRRRKALDAISCKEKPVTTVKITTPQNGRIKEAKAENGQIIRIGAFSAIR
jgi:hypothetical protein